MEQNNNFPEVIKSFMDKVKKEILSKSINQGNLTQNKEIIDSLFNLLDYQITLVNQIFLFGENNKENAKENNEDNNNNYDVENLINVNKDILVSMINKFLSNLYSIFNVPKNNGKNKYNLMNKSNNLFKRGKIINLLYSSGNNNNIMVSNSFAKKISPIKKKVEKEYNLSKSLLTLNTPLKKIEPIFDNEKNSYTFLKNRNIVYNTKNKNNKNVYDKLYYDKDSRCDHDEKRKNKAFLYQSYSKSMKDIFVDLNTDYISNLFKDKKYMINKKVKKEKEC